NRLSGNIPKQLLQLPLLTKFLDLSYNHMSGSIPLEIKDLKMLSYLSLSYNKLSGTITSSPGVFANASAFSISGNNKLCGGLVTLELPKCKEKGSKKKRFPFFIFVIKRNNQSSQSSGNEKVSYNELLNATDGFSADNLIGEGGFSSVYKGILNSDDDRCVAIKVLYLQNRGAHKGFQAECEAWRNIRHRNALKIITSCSTVDFQGNDFKAMVYEFIVWYWERNDKLWGHLLEVMTGKNPTDGMFNEGLSLRKFAYMALPDHVIDVIDNDAIVMQSTEANARKVEECLAATIKIGVSCSVDSPSQRMKIEIVINELQRILVLLQNI
nr:protein kinase-like domain-containing protein [Tanacetum cinerariifolium]